jgi:hypothetical protein
MKRYVIICEILIEMTGIMGEWHASLHVYPTGISGLAGGKLRPDFLTCSEQEFCRIGNEVPTSGGSDPLGCLVFARFDTDQSS